MEEENVIHNGEETVSAEHKNAEPSLGKFKSVDALLRAYGELEAEFTRRSQRLKALEEMSKEAEAPKIGQTEAPSSCEQAQSGAPSEELYRAVMQDESVKARVLSDYLQSLKGVPLLTKSGTGVTAPQNRPKSFAEAGNLALGYLKSVK